MAKQLILAVAFSDEQNQYHVDIPAGSNVNETSFAMAVVIKCLLKDGVIKSADEVLDNITKYLEDSQYAEVQEAKEETEE